MMVEDLAIEAKEAAVRDVAKLLTLPELLQSIASIKADYIARQQANDAQLSTMVAEQVEQAQAGLESLASSQKKVNQLRGNFVSIDNLCQECQTLIENHDQIKLLSNARNNLNATLKDAEGMMSISLEAAKAHDTLVDDRELTSTYERLAALDGKRRFALAAVSSHSEEVGKLREYFEDVDRTWETFDKKLWGLIYDFFKLAKESPQTLVRALRVVEMQEIFDQQLAEEEAEAVGGGAMASVANPRRTPNMDANTQSSAIGRGKNKRFWKKEEEEALIDCLLDLVGDRQWKGEGGFKNGYLTRLEVMLNTKFPDCGLKAIPHIESKFKWFKEKYAVVSEMVNKTSGFQWDDQTKMIQYEKQAYDDFCKNHPKAGGLWRTPFPYLDKLDLVFGIDRANGIASELPEDSINNLEEIVNLANDNTDDDSPPQPPAMKKIKKEKTPKGTEKKKSAQTIDLTSNHMATEFTGFMKGMSSHLSTIANAMSSTENRELEVVKQKKVYFLR